MRHQLGELQWSDLSVVLAVCRAGSLAGAARLLRCNHSTVFRRINAIEKGVGVRFFERLPTGYAMTDAGEVAFSFAERIEGEFQALNRQILGRDARLQGNVCVTGPDGLVTRILPELLAEFRQTHSEVTIELLEGMAAVSLGRREADIAVRATRKPPDDSLGRKVSDFRFGVYAAPSYLERVGTRSLDEVELVILEGTMSWLVPHLWKSRARAEERVVFRSNAATAVISAALAGMGATLMPCYRCDPEPGLVRLEVLEFLTMELWVLTHPALRHTARVKALMAFLVEALGERSALFDGSSAG